MTGRAEPFVHWFRMTDALETEFPLFPLGLVAVPHELVPLHIFEARYRLMVGECLDEEREFGIVWASPDGLRDVGCAVEIAEVVERLEDGRLNILVRGTRPFRLHERSDALGYPAGTVEWLDDELEEPEEEAAAETREAYRVLVAAATEHELDDEDLAEAVWTAGVVQVGWGDDPALAGAREQARSGDPSAAHALRNAAHDAAPDVAPPR